MVGKACLPSNAYYPRTPDYTLYSGVHVCLSEHSDSSFVYGFMSLDYGCGTYHDHNNLESTQWDYSNEYTQHNFMIKSDNVFKYLFS